MSRGGEVKERQKGGKNTEIANNALNKYKYAILKKWVFFWGIMYFD